MAQPSSSSPLDPMQMWRDLVAQWEKGTNEFSSQAFTSDPFKQGMHGGMNATLQMQQQLGEFMAKFLSSLNLPSRDDVQALGEQLTSIDSLLGRIARALESNGNNGASSSSGAASARAIAGPPRTRQPAKPGAAAPAQVAAAPAKTATPAKPAKPATPAAKAPTATRKAAAAKGRKA